MNYVLTHGLVLLLVFRPGSRRRLVTEPARIDSYVLPLVGQPSGGPGVVQLGDFPHGSCNCEPEAAAGWGLLQLGEWHTPPDEWQDGTSPLRRRNWP